MSTYVGICIGLGDEEVEVTPEGLAAWWHEHEGYRVVVHGVRIIVTEDEA